MLAKLKVVVACGLVGLAGLVVAADREAYVPDELKPWTGWVLKDKEYRACPFFFNRRANQKDDFVCAWPGRLDLGVGAEGGQFSQRWTVQATEQWLPLPGDKAHWPQRVTVNGQSFSVVARGGKPSVRLPPGRHTVAGRFAWNERPRTLRVPSATGLLDLTIDGEPVPRPQRNGRGVWLGEREQAKKAEDALRVEAYRQVVDDVPTRLTTVLRLEVAGSVREELIGPAMPDGFVPLALDSALPARLEPDGNLRLQVRPGNWEVTLSARAGGVLNEIELAQPVNNLPTTEIWSYSANDKTRVSAPAGLQPVDPRQVAVPAQWQELPAFRIQPGEKMTIAERSRGRLAVDNQLTLRRELWLDFDTDGFVFSDDVGGFMRSDWRLDMAEPYSLLSASEGDDNLLVTLGIAQGLSGVEVRQSRVALEALGRTETRGALPITGWQARFNSVNASLHLPPGNKLLTAIGSDSSSMSWVNRWKLLDFFLVLIVSIATARLFGRGVGVLALVALTLSLHEVGAPEFAWLNLLVAVALVRVAPEGRLLQISKIYRVLSFVSVAVIIVPFVADQLRIALYPQLESQGYSAYSQSTALRERKDMASPADVAATMENAAKGAVRGLAVEAPQSLEEIVVTGQKRQQSFSRYAPNAIVQVGPGHPAWRWNTYQLSWSGPVDSDQTMRLVVMPRWLVTVLRFVEVLLLGALLAVFAFEFLNRRPPWSRGRQASGKTVPSAAAMLVVCIAGCLAVATPAVLVAEVPSDSILGELEKRLTEPPACAPRCAEIIEARAVVEADAMTIRLTVAALETVAIPLPGSLQGWRPEQIRIDGPESAQIYRSSDQTLWIRVAEGRSEISLQGPLPPVDALEVPFPEAPRAISVVSSDWFIAGIDNHTLTSGSLQLTRLRRPDDKPGEVVAARWESSRFPAFARIERYINLDLDWRVETTVYRVAPQQGAVTLNVPLLPGEAVTTEGLTVKDGAVTVSLNPGQPAASWQSTLPLTSPLKLETGIDSPWKEVWRFGIGSIWHASFSGIPENETGEEDLGYRIAEFFPRPGEALAMTVERPAASAGDTLVFDEVRLDSQLGERSRTSNLTLRYRSTRGTQHVLGLPEEAEIVAVSIDGETAPLRPENGELRVPILPGEHNIAIEWRTGDTLGIREQAPRVDIGASASNIHTSLSLAPNRWVLATFGTALGPAVLYWSELLVLILLALILGREKLTPLGTIQWLLLGLGFSTFSWYALAFVAIWLLATGAQRPWKSSLGLRQFNAVQIVFAFISIAALITIVVSLPVGLLGHPDMHVVGNGSYNNYLQWFADRSDATLPTPEVVSLPLWIYKVLILAWALWLSFALLRWLPWVWREFSGDGLWRSKTESAN